MGSSETASQNVHNALLFLENETTSLMMLYTASNKLDTLDLEKGKFLHKHSYQEETEILGQILYIKERFAISDCAHHDLSMACIHLPRLWDIKPCLNGNGKQQPIESRLRERVYVLIEDKKLSLVTCCKSSCQGMAQKCRKLNLITSTFTLLNEGDVASNHTVAIINGNENYDSQTFAKR